MFLFKTTVDTIVKDFNKAIQRLEELADVERNKADAMNAKANALASKALGKKWHAERAESIASKIKELISA